MPKNIQKKRNINGRLTLTVHVAIGILSCFCVILSPTKFVETNVYIYKINATIKYMQSLLWIFAGGLAVLLDF